VPKNLISSSFFSLKPAIRDSSGDLPPRNDGKEETLRLRLRVTSKKG